MLGQPGGRRLLSNELLRVLWLIAEWELGIHEQLAGFLNHSQKVSGWDRPKCISSSLGFPHVTRDHASVRLAHLGDLFTAVEVDDLLDVEALVGLAPA
jgi:hypothetical protein